MTNANVIFIVSARGRSSAKGLVGVLELERVEEPEVRSRTVIRNLHAPVGSGFQSVPVRLSAGSYLSKLRLPSGEHISELVHIVPGEELQRVVLGETSNKTLSRPSGRVPARSSYQLSQGRGVEPIKIATDQTFSARQVVERKRASLEQVGHRKVNIESFSIGGGVLAPPPNLVDIASSANGGDLADYLNTRRWQAREHSGIDAAPIEVLACAGQSSDLLHRLHQRGLSDEHPARQLIDPLGLKRSHQQLVVISSSSRSARLRIDEDGDYHERQSAYLVVSRLASRRGDNRTSMRACLMRIPASWQNVRRQQKSGIFLDVGGATHRSSPWRLSVDDPELQSVIDFTQQKDLNGALVVLDLSLHLLMMKVENPYAAAAAGYVLLLTPPSRTPSGWFDWIGNLGSWFDDLPDGLIQHATLLLQRSWEDQADSLEPRYFPLDEQERTRLAAELLLRALRRGLPLYRSGLTLLASNLFILDGSSQLAPEVATTIKRARQYVNGLRHLVDTTQAFTTLDISNLT